MIRDAPDGRGGSVSVAVHDPVGTSLDGPVVLLTHGAGGNRDTPGLVSLAERLAKRDIRTLRFNLPAAEAGKRRPDSSARATACIAAVTGWAAQQYSGPLFLGGRSFGGRMASLLLADPAGEARSLVTGAVLLAYPLKPPGKLGVPPERMEHLGRGWTSAALRQWIPRSVCTAGTTGSDRRRGGRRDALDRRGRPRIPGAEGSARCGGANRCRRSGRNRRSGGDLHCRHCSNGLARLCALAR